MVFSDLVHFFSSSDFPLVTSRYVFSIALADIVRIESIVISIDSRSNVESFHVIRYPEKRSTNTEIAAWICVTGNNGTIPKNERCLLGRCNSICSIFFSRYSSQFSYWLHGLVFHSLLFTWSRCDVQIFGVVDIHSKNW